jgi:Right handed beta helix region
MIALLLAATITVAADADLQAAIDRAKAGETIELEPGAIYTGHFMLPDKGGDAVTTITTRGADARAPRGRISPADAASFAKLRTPDNDPALATAAGAHHWRITLLDISGADDGDLVALGSGSHEQTIKSQIPHDLVVDRVYIHGDPARGRRRGISLNSAATTVTRSYIADIKAVGRDAQAICGWNGPGPFTIADNYLEASTENVMFGGADPGVQDLVPSDITITGNTLTKPPQWRQERWEIKNILELKNARHVVVRNNVLEYSWKAGQSGFAVMLTVRNQDGACPWCEVSDVVFENNLVQHSGSAVNILGVDNNHPSKQTRGIVFRGNLFADIDNQRWGGGGYAIQITGGPRDITFDHNTIVQEHGAGFLQVEGPPISGFVFTDNVVRQSVYGAMGRDRAPGSDSLTTYFPAARFTNNLIVDGDGSHYPSGNRFPSFREVCEQMVSCESMDYRWRTEGAFKGAGTTQPLPAASAPHNPQSSAPTNRDR